MTDDSETRRARALRAQAALDSELDAANALVFEQDSTTDEALRRARESGEALRATLRVHAVREPAPDALRARVLALAEPQKSDLTAARWMALAASFCAVAFLAGYFLGSRQGASPEEAALRPLVDSFARAEISGQPFDVASSDRHTVKPWLASRMTLGAEVVDLTEAGFPLAGGRVDIVDRSPVATLVYRHREHWIDVSELPLRPGATASTSEASMLDGFRVRRWSDGARTYVAVSDIDAAELDGFVEAFRHKSSLPTSGAEPSPG